MSATQRQGAYFAYGAEFYTNNYITLLECANKQIKVKTPMARA